MNINRDLETVKEIIEQGVHIELSRAEREAIDITMKYAGLFGVSVSIALYTEMIKTYSMEDNNEEVIVSLVRKNIGLMNYLSHHIINLDMPSVSIVPMSVQQSRGIEFLYLHYPALSLLEVITKEEDADATQEFLTIYRCMLAIMYDFKEYL